MNVIKTLKGHIPPVAIGGVGGSGTRLIANCLEELNYYIGSDLNKAKDNLWFTLLFKHIEILQYNNRQTADLLNIFLQGMLTQEAFSNQWDVEHQFLPNMDETTRARKYADWQRAVTSTLRY